MLVCLFYGVDVCLFSQIFKIIYRYLLTVGVFHLDKKQASKFLKTLLIECKLDSNSYVLVDPNPKDALSTGYKIKVKTIMNNDCRQQIKRITKKHNLAVKEEPDQIVVYKPKASSLDIS